MNRGRFIGGVICLAVAVLLLVLAVVLPDEDMVFQVGDENIPFLPSIILGIVGVALVATSGRSPGRSAPAEQSGADTVAPSAEAAPSEDAPLSEKALLNKQLERMGWGAFLIMLGGFALVPDDLVPRGLWSIGLGLIWLGLNYARHSKGIKMSGFTTFLGIVCLVGGFLELAGWGSVGGAIFLIALGVFVIAKPWIEQRGLFGKAEED